jgi:hypothetical protein
MDFLKSEKQMARFQIGDKIELMRRNEVIRKGLVISGPFNVEKVDHYNVRWDWVEKEDSMFIGQDKIDLISDLSSEKYRYRLSN